MATIYDIAKVAGVTAATVSNVLSGKGSVSATTRERVLKCAQDLGYEPNLIARSLIKGRTGVIGLILPDLGNPFFANVTTTVEHLAYQAGLRIFVTTLSKSDQIGQRMLKDLALRRVDGFLVACSALPPYALRLMNLPAIPVVYCFSETAETGGQLCVTLDYVQGGRLATEHLLQLGHRRIGMVTHMNRDGQPDHIARVSGFQEALSQYGLPFHPELLQAGQSTVQEGKIAGLKLLSLPEPPTAIFATNDMMAMGVIAAAWELGISIPDRLSIVGFDDIPLASYTTPPLTTITISQHDLIGQALTALLNAIEGRPVSSPPPLPATLTVRHSTSTCTPPVTENTSGKANLSGSTR